MPRNWYLKTRISTPRVSERVSDKRPSPGAPGTGGLPQADAQVCAARLAPQPEGDGAAETFLVFFVAMTPGGRNRELSPTYTAA